MMEKRSFLQNIVGFDNTGPVMSEVPLQAGEPFKVSLETRVSTCVRFQY